MVFCIYICSEMSKISIEIMTTEKKINFFSLVLIAVTVLGITVDILSKVIWFANNSDSSGSDAYRSGFEAGLAAADGSLPLTFTEVFGVFMFVPIVIAFFRLWINFIGIMATVKRGEVFPNFWNGESVMSVSP